MGCVCEGLLCLWASISQELSLQWAAVRPCPLAPLGRLILCPEVPTDLRGLPPFEPACKPPEGECQLTPRSGPTPLCISAPARAAANLVSIFFQ